jgi:hypothetical protein
MKKRMVLTGIISRAAIALLVVSLAFIGCGGDDDGGTPAGGALTGVVRIAGNVQAGQTLTVDILYRHGTGTISYQWIRGTTDISGETGSTYTLVAADTGNTITVRVSRAGYSGTITSNPTRTVSSFAWTAVGNSTFGASTINGIAYGNNTFVAGGNENQHTPPVEAYGNSKFVAGGSDGKMAYSSDGVTWTAVGDSTFGSYGISGIAYGNNTFVAGGNENQHTPPVEAYGNNMFVAGGNDGKMAYSSDGVTWTAEGYSTFGASDSIRSIAYGNNRWVAGGDDGKMAYSDD